MENRVIKTELVEWQKLEWFQPAELKKANKESIQKLKKSLVRNGFILPFNIWKNKTKTYILDGHHREKALKELVADGVKIPAKLPANYINCKNNKDAKKLVILYDTRYSRFNIREFYTFVEDMDIDLLSSEIQLPDFTMGAVNLLGMEIKQDKLPKIKLKNPKTKVGDIYTLGNHRVMCGDCTNVDNLQKLMYNKKIDMIYTDPPYGVNIHAKGRLLNTMVRKGKFRDDDMSADTKKAAELQAYLTVAFSNMKKFLKDSSSVYVSVPQGGDLGEAMLAMMRESGLPVRHTLIWAKNRSTFSMGRLDYEYKHEPLFYTWNKTHKFYGNGQFRETVWNIDNPVKSKEHPTMKPIELIVNAIMNSTAKGMIINDCFLGSGSSLIASEQTDRICYGMELLPKYVDVIVQRWVNFTGKEKIKKNGKVITWPKEKNIDKKKEK